MGKQFLEKNMKFDLTEELCIVALAVICVVAITTLKSSSTQIVSAIGGGLVGYLTRGLVKK